MSKKGNKNDILCSIFAFFLIVFLLRAKFLLHLLHELISKRVMQKIIILLFALLTGVGVNAQSVYVATSKGAVAYHKDKSCGYLRNANEVKSISVSSAKDMGRHACSACYGESAAATKKVAEKRKPATTTKKVEKEVKEMEPKKDVTKKVRKEKEMAEVVEKVKKTKAATAKEATKTVKEKTKAVKEAKADAKEKKTSAKAAAKDVEKKAKTAAKKADTKVKETAKKASDKAKEVKETTKTKKEAAKKTTKKKLDKAA